MLSQFEQSLQKSSQNPPIEGIHLEFALYVNKLKEFLNVIKANLHTAAARQKLQEDIQALNRDWELSRDSHRAWQNLDKALSEYLPFVDSNIAKAINKHMARTAEDKKSQKQGVTD